MDSTESILSPSQPAEDEPKEHRKVLIQTRYMQMLLQQEEISKRDNFLASLCTWLQLAGWVFFPGTFTHPPQAMKNATKSITIAAAIYDSVQNLPLVLVATICCIIGTSGVVWLYWKWNSNFMWLTRQIFCLINSVTGFANALINVYTTQGGMWSVTAKATASVTGAFAIIFMGLFLLYNNWLLMKVQRDHKAELNNSDHVQETP